MGIVQGNGSSVPSVAQFIFSHYPSKLPNECRLCFNKVLLLLKSEIMIQKTLHLNEEKLGMKVTCFEYELISACLQKPEYSSWSGPHSPGPAPGTSLSQNLNSGMRRVKYLLCLCQLFPVAPDSIE